MTTGKESGSVVFLLTIHRIRSSFPLLHLGLRLSYGVNEDRSDRDSKTKDAGNIRSSCRIFHFINRILRS